MPTTKTDEPDETTIELDDAWPAIFGAEIRAWRTGAGMSVATLAKRAGVSDRSIVYLEAGKHPPNMATILRILAAGLPWRAFQRATKESVRA